MKAEDLRKKAEEFGDEFERHLNEVPKTTAQEIRDTCNGILIQMLQTFGREVYNMALEDAESKCTATYAVNDAVTKNIIEQVERAKHRIESLKLDPEGKPNV